VNGAFTDTFATAATVHIYEVNDGGSTATPDPPAPAAPAIGTGVANADKSVTLSGTAPAGSTVTVSDGGSTALGSTTTSSSSAWTYTTTALAAGSYAFTATDSTSAGTSAASSPLDVTVPGSSSQPSGPNLVVNGNFATDSFSGWTLGGNDAPDPVYGPQIYINTTGEGGSTHAAAMGSSGSDGAMSQTIATTPGQTYTLSFWLENQSSGPNDFSAIWNGQTLLSLGNAAAFGYTEYSYTVTATSSSTVLEFAARQDPSHWDLDNISLSTSAPTDPSQPSGPNLVVNGNFATDSFSGWTLGGNDAPDPVYGPQIYINTTGEGGSTHAAAMGSSGSNGTISQTIATTPGQTYTLSFWLESQSSGPNDFSAIWNGQTLLSLSNAAAFGYTEYTYTVTATSSSTVLEFAARQDPSHWDLDNISLTANGTSSSTPTAIQTAVLNPNTDPTVTLKGTAPAGSTVTVSDGGSTPLGTTTASGTGTWSFTTPDLPAGSYVFTATDARTAGTSTFDVTLPAPPATPAISTGVANADESVTLTGTAPAGSTVTMSDGGSTPLGTTSASTSGAWSYTTTALTAGSFAFTATDTTSAGTSAASNAFDVTVNAPVTIQAGRRVELSQAYAGSVTFNGSTGTLILDSPSTFSGEIFNFTGNGRLSGSDRIDLKGINSNSVRDSYANGVLTVTDGSGDTAKLHFNGSYTLGNFKFANDGHGGTIVYDPPVAPASSECQSSTSLDAVGTSPSGATGAVSALSGMGSQKGIVLPTIAFDPPSTLGYLPNRQSTGGTPSLTEVINGPNIALLGSYMASSFAIAGDNHGGTLMASDALEAHHPLLTGPQHT
jgi:hypothetical protein